MGLTKYSPAPHFFTSCVLEFIVYQRLLNEKLRDGLCRSVVGINLQPWTDSFWFKLRCSILWARIALYWGHLVSTVESLSGQWRNQPQHKTPLQSLTRQYMGLAMLACTDFLDSSSKPLVTGSSWRLIDLKAALWFVQRMCITRSSFSLSGKLPCYCEIKNFFPC